MNKPNILYFDIENSPLLGHAWGTYQTDVLNIVKDTELLSFAYKVSEEPVKVVSRRLFTERQLVIKLWKLFNDADIIVAHNGDKFDIKMANQYFIKYKLKPPSPYKSVDTLKLAKKYFRFSQNKLDYLTNFLFKENKVHTTMELWFRCMEGNEEALVQMEQYNKHDVVLLHKLYKTLRGWHTGHPNTNLYEGSSHKCPICGGNTQKRGFGYTRVSKYQRYQCVGQCKGWSTGERIPLEDKVIR